MHPVMSMARIRQRLATCSRLVSSLWESPPPVFRSCRRAGPSADLGGAGPAGLQPLPDAGIELDALGQRAAAAGQRRLARQAHALDAGPGRRVAAGRGDPFGLAAEGAAAGEGLGI